MWFRRTPEKILAQRNTRFAINDLISRIDRRRRWKELSDAEKTLILCWHLECEVLNGTIDQYLSNSSGDLFFETMTALETIGATSTRAVLSEVAAWFPDSKPSPDRRTRCMQLAPRQDAPTYEAEVRDITDRLTTAFKEMRQHLVKHLKENVVQIR
jgi:hypothetical protein